MNMFYSLFFICNVYSNHSTILSETFNTMNNLLIVIITINRAFMSVLSLIVDML